MSVRVLVVDDHAVVRRGLRLVFEAAGLDVVGEAASGREAVFQSRALEPEVVVLDLVMPDQDGLAVLPQLLRERPDLKVLVLSMQDEPEYVREAFAAGAAGYVVKDAADAEVVGAVHEVAAGARYLHPDLGARMLIVEAEERKHAAEDPLSEREREVLRLLALGYTNQEISKQLYISVRTAETHRSHIMRKLGLETRAALVQYALREGLLEA